MKFYDPKMFYLLGVVFFGALMHLRLHFRKKEAMARLGDPEMVRAMCGSVSRGKRFFRIFIKLLAMALLVAAVARPKSGLKEETMRKTGIDVILALDVSKSMLAKDMAPNRFERAKLELLLLVDKLKNDRVGLVLFSGTAFMQMPLTLDYSAAKLFIKGALIDSLPQPGTTGAAVIELCLDVFKRVGDRAKAVIIFSDGEFHDERFRQAVAQADREGVAIYAVGFGTETGGPIPVPMKGGVTDFKKDRKGNVVLTKMDSEKLTEITRLAGGRYYNASEPDLIGKITEDFVKLEKRSFEETIYTQLEEKFEIPLVFAGLMLLAESLMTERKTDAASKKREA